MGRAPCCEKIGLRRGRWTAEEDRLLSDYIQAHGEGSWRSLPKNAGLLRCGKSCRLRWINYLRSDVKRGNISPEEEDTIVKLHAKLGNRWSLIAGHLSGRTDNEIKNYWNSHLSRKISPASSPTILTKRRSSAMKIKKPRKTTSTVPPSSENTGARAGAGASTGTDGEVILAESSNSVNGEMKEKELDELFDDEGLLMDMEAAASHVSMVLNEQEDLVVSNNTINSASSSTDDDSNQQQGGKQDNLEWEWEWESCDWDFEGVSMIGLDGGEGDDDIMSWPWESERPTQPVGLDVEKQEAFIAWLLS